MNRKYIAVLAIVSALLLIGGALVRPRRELKPTVPVATAPPPQPSRRGQMRQISDFLAERVAESARHVVFVPEHQASGVVLDRGMVITSSESGAPLTVTAAAPGQTVIPARLAEEAQISRAGGWALVIGRNAEGDPISASAILGGSADTNCAGSVSRKLLLNVPLDATYAGSGVFDVGGDLLGVVGRCDGAWMAFSHASVMKLLEGQSGAGAVVWRDLGLRLGTAGESERQVLRLPQGGLYVAEVRRNSRAASAGLRPGDLLLSSAGNELASPEDLAKLGETITLLRAGRRLNLPTDPNFSVDDTLPGAILSYVHEGSRLHNAGLRAGDTIIAIGGQEHPSAATVTRILAANRPVFAIYARADRRIGVLLP